MQRQVLFIVTFIFALPFILKAEELTLTLDEAIAIALRDNRDILLKTEDVKKAKEKIAEAQAGIFPTLNFTGSQTYTRGLYPKDINATTSQTTLKQYLYKGGEIINTIKYNEFGMAVTEAILDKTKLETILNVKKAFYILLLAKEFTDINKSIVENINQHLGSLKERYENGEVSRSDILNIEAYLLSVRQAYEVSLNQTEASLALLNNLLYIGEGINLKPAAQFIYEPVELAYDEAFLKAMQDRPEIKQYAAQIQKDLKAIEIAKSDNRPNIYASWDYYSRSTTSLTFSPTKGWQDYNIVGVTFSWPIFDGWLTKAKVEQAMIDLKETQLLKDKNIFDIALELKNAYLALKNAIAKIASCESEVKVYTDNLLTLKEKYGQGIASFLDLSDANLKLDLALFNRKQAIYDYIIAKSDFDKATGGL